MHQCKRIVFLTCYVAVSSVISIESVAMETLQCVYFCIVALCVAGDSKTYWCPNVKCQVLTEFGFSRQIFIKGPSFKFCGCPSSGSRANACEPTKLICFFLASMRTRPVVNWMRCGRKRLWPGVRFCLSLPWGTEKSNDNIQNSQCLGYSLCYPQRWPDICMCPVACCS